MAIRNGAVITYPFASLRQPEISPKLPAQLLN